MLVGMYRNMNPHVLLVGMLNDTATLENSLAVPPKVKHRLTVRPSNSSSMYIPKRNENTCPCKNLYMSVHSSIIHNGQKLKTNQMSIK